MSPQQPRADFKAESWGSVLDLFISLEVKIFLSKKEGDFISLVAILDAYFTVTVMHKLTVSIQ